MSRPSELCLGPVWCKRLEDVANRDTHHDRRHEHGQPIHDHFDWDKDILQTDTSFFFLKKNKNTDHELPLF